MQGRKNYSEKLFVSFQLSDRVPKENFYRRLSETLDMQFLYGDTRELYGKTGNPSIDPVVFFKLMLTGYLENITSDRRLMEHCSMRMDILYFIGYDIDEQLPWHSTVSRTRQLYPATLFESLFEKVFVMCIEKGMVAGHTHAVDSAPIKANASIQNLELRVPAQSIKAHLTAVDSDNPGENESGKGDKTAMTASPSQLKRLAKYQDNLNATRANRPGAKNEKAQLLSNKTHYNPRDPDARISIKPGKARKLNYNCSMSVDAAHGVISHIQADFADGRDSQYLPRIVSVLQDRLRRNHLQLTDLMADAGYSNGYNYQFLEKRKITGWIPVFGKFRPQLDGFDYNKETDSYTCPNGKKLPFRSLEYSTEGKPLKAYWTTRSDCATCPLKQKCIPKAGTKRIVKTIYEEEYQRAHFRQQTTAGKRMKGLRQGTVEPVFGSLTQYYGLNKIPVLGIDGAHKTMLMAAIAFNIRKYMKYNPKKVAENALHRAKNHLSEQLDRFTYHLGAEFGLSF